ncbi:16S rRNA (cytidine(1402)-2'-O)-methyltransferase [Candidatus Falkowbacteria bacterium]|jgi:16S rRNA (cytidine1402-2'-O)-methyltransferase|nr:16S rRNA (cytidine(1402)-2'-O)-methyltransferase [Candidatus Falkowbacteria bacterium]MBT4433091.1 16S rRNA (cytidine(1402)-2'-O)-methyltransferase [Candidatus Falkowbacteria bacterium]
MKKEFGKLYIVATPIGNLEDITFRAVKTLKEVDFILCEDTRVTKKLLDRYEIQKPTISYHHHSGKIKVDKILKLLKEGKNLGLVTDAGTPGVSDPGGELISAVLNEFDKKVVIIPIPGASALGAIVSVAGINMQNFTFLGYPPHKKGRETYFKKVAESKIPIVYYESPYRVIKNLELLKKFSNKKVIVGRELTKMFEEVVRGEIQEILDYFENKAGKIKGEFTIIVY